MITLQDDQLDTIVLSLDHGPIGLINYAIDGDVMIITHTEVDPPHQGKGYAEFLVQSAVELAKLQGYKPGATCPYAVKYFAAKDISNNAPESTE